jgi:hypothetical protein
MSQISEQRLLGISEESLDEEIRALEAGEILSDEQGTGSSDEDSDTVPQLEQVITARNEILKQIECVSAYQIGSGQSWFALLIMA